MKKTRYVHTLQFSKSIRLIPFAIVSLVVVSISSCKKDNSEPATPFIGITVENKFKTQPDTVKFIANSTIPCSYSWNFGDGSSDETGETVTHIFDIGYYYVTLTATSDANKTASVLKGVNTSKYKRAVINNVKFSQLPLLKPDGSPWDSDGTRPDVFCEISTGTRKGTTATVENADWSSGGGLSLNFFPSFSDSLFDQPLVIKVYNSNELPQENDLIEIITLDRNLIDLIKNQEPYDTTKPFETGNVVGSLGFFWAL